MPIGVIEFTLTQDTCVMFLTMNKSLTYLHLQLHDDKQFNANEADPTQRATNHLHIYIYSYMMTNKLTQMRQTLLNGLQTRPQLTVSSLV